MPKETFFNLPVYKQETILKAAVQEFSESRYSEASINKIVKASSISRGSFYQYFLDKGDVFDYIVEGIRRDKLKSFNQFDSEHDYDFFETYKRTTLLMLTWAKEHPEYNNIGLLIEQDDHPALDKHKTLSSKGEDRLISLVRKDMACGKLKPETDPELLVEVITTITHSLLKDIFKSEEKSVPLLLKKLDDTLSIVKYGVSK